MHEISECQQFQSQTVATPLGLVAKREHQASLVVSSGNLLKFAMVFSMAHLVWWFTYWWLYSSYVPWQFLLAITREFIELQISPKFSQSSSRSPTYGWLWLNFFGTRSKGGCNIKDKQLREATWHPMIGPTPIILLHFVLLIYHLVV